MKRDKKSKPGSKHVTMTAETIAKIERIRTIEKRSFTAQAGLILERALDEIVEDSK